MDDSAHLWSLLVESRHISVSQVRMVLASMVAVIQFVAVTRLSTISAAESATGNIAIHWGGFWITFLVTMIVIWNRSTEAQHQFQEQCHDHLKNVCVGHVLHLLLVHG